jgi:hypothetical protein
MRFATLTRGAALIAAGCALALGSGAALAESACKGLEQNACGKAADCIWVGGYERKDGKQVSGYCRTKSTGGAADDKQDEKEAVAKTPARTPAKTQAVPATPKTPATPTTPSVPGTAKDKVKAP